VTPAAASADKWGIFTTDSGLYIGKRGAAIWSAMMNKMCGRLEGIDFLRRSEGKAHRLTKFGDEKALR
jgi:hypothetical protein